MPKQKAAHCPHDAYFKKIFENIEATKDFLKEFLPKEVLKQLDMSSVKIENVEFFDAYLNRHFADVLISIKMTTGRWFYTYVLFEHLRNPDRFLPLRLMEYMIFIMTYHLKKHKSKELPLVVPIVVYNGDRKYPYSMKFTDLYPKELQEMMQSIYTEAFPLIDLSELEVEQIENPHVHMGLSSLKYGPSALSGAETARHIKKGAKWLAERGEIRYIQDALTYVYLVKPSRIKEELLVEMAKQFEPLIGEKTMYSVADSLRDEGFRKGRQEGRQEGREEGHQEGRREMQKILIKKLFLRSMSIEEISEILSLKVNEVQKTIKTIQEEIY